MRNIEQEVKDYFKDKSEECYVYLSENSCQIELINSNCFNFETMMWLSEFFGTKKIDGERPYTISEGCETCGDGSQVQQIINVSKVVWPEGFSGKEYIEQEKKAQEQASKAQIEESKFWNNWRKSQEQTQIAKAEKKTSKLEKHRKTLKFGLNPLKSKHNNTYELLREKYGSILEKMVPPIKSMIVIDGQYYTVISKPIEYEDAVSVIVERDDV